MSEKIEKKMTLEEYQEKYTHPENAKLIRGYLFLIEAAIGAIIFICLLLAVFKIYDMNNYAGYVSAGIAVVLFILVYIIPMAKIKSTKAFITNVDHRNAREAKKYNKKLREDIADKMIDIKAKTDGISWYSDENIGKLAIARNTKDDKALKDALTVLYKTDVKKACNKLIRDYSFKTGITTAISQDKMIDTLFITVFDFQLIKNIIYMYGYRPSDAKLLKIYKTVIVDALIAYGFQDVSSALAKGAAKQIGKVVGGIPLVGGLVKTGIDITIDGLTNACLTSMIGFQTKKYLVKEYKLQDMLDEVVISEEEDLEEQKEILEDVSKGIKNARSMKNETVAI